MIEELHQRDMRRMELALQCAAKMLRHAMQENLRFDVDAVFTSLEALATRVDALPPVASKDFLATKKPGYAGWAMDGAKACLSMVGRFTSKPMSGNVVELVGTWLQVDKPDTFQKVAKPYTHNGLGAAHSPDNTKTMVW